LDDLEDPMSALERVEYRALTVALLSVVLSGCTISNPKFPVGLDPAEVIPVGVGAPKNAEPVSIAKPRDVRSDPEVAHTYIAPLASLLIPVVIKDSYVIEQDPGVWIGNGLTAGLENAGYRVNHIKDPKDAKTSVVIVVEVTRLTSEQETHFLRIGRKSTVAADVKIAKAGKGVFERAYQGEDEEEVLGAQGDAQSKAMAEAMKKALENLLNRAVPEIAAALAPLTQP
jgi:hypothetical protein